VRIGVRAQCNLAKLRNDEFCSFAPEFTFEQLGAFDDAENCYVGELADESSQETNERLEVAPIYSIVPLAEIEEAEVELVK
jgi:hypothetical protein